MGLLDIIFGREKYKNIRVERGEEHTTQATVYARVSDGESEGISTEQAKQLALESEEVFHTANLDKIVLHSNKLLTSGAYDEMIAFSQMVIQKYPNADIIPSCYNDIGVAYFFKKDYPTAIEFYQKAMQKGLDTLMMEDNIWEAAEVHHQKTGSISCVETYLNSFPKGEYSKQAKKLLK